MIPRRYPKGSDERISEDFMAMEFDCPCKSCKWTVIDMELVKRLQTVRELLDCGLKITSGYRCENQQEDLRLRGYEVAKGPSTHSMGKAADIRTGRHSGAEIEKAAREAGFRAVGVGGTWAHVDLRDERDRRWTYSR